MKADIAPNSFFRNLRLYPMVNTENNYTQEQLAKMYELINENGGINGMSYRNANKDGSYAGQVSPKNFNDPLKVLEWSIGQTGYNVDENGNHYTTDNFAYDTKDTFKTYPDIFKRGNGSFIKGLRIFLGTIGSKGYDNKQDSATAIKTRIPVSKQKEAWLKINKNKK